MECRLFTGFNAVVSQTQYKVSDAKRVNTNKGEAMPACNGGSNERTTYTDERPTRGAKCLDRLVLALSCRSRHDPGGEQAGIRRCPLDSRLSLAFWTESLLRQLGHWRIRLS